MLKYYKCKEDFTATDGMQYYKGNTIPPEQWEALTEEDQAKFRLVTRARGVLVHGKLLP